VHVYWCVQVTIYTTFQSLDDLTAVSLFKYYLNRTSTTQFIVRPLQLPVGIGSVTSKAARDRLYAGLAGIAFNDCVLRHSHDPNVNYVALSTAADEIVVPRQKSLNYSSMLGRQDTSKRASLSLRGATFSTDANNEIEDSFLTTIRFRSRDKMAQSDRHVIDPLRCAVVSSAGACIELVSRKTTPLDDKDVFIMPPSAGSWQYYRACVEDVTKQCAAYKDFTMMRYQKQLKLNIVQVMKDSGIVTSKEDIHQIALRL